MAFGKPCAETSDSQEQVTLPVAVAQGSGCEGSVGPAALGTDFRFEVLVLESWCWRVAAGRVESQLAPDILA